MLAIFKHTGHQLAGLKSERLVNKVLVPALFFHHNTLSQSVSTTTTAITTTTTSARASCQVLSKNMRLFPHSPQAQQYVNSQHKPLCVILNWLQAKHEHVMKYGDFYRNQGFDVLSVHITPWQLIRPVPGAQLVAEDVLQFLVDRSDYRSIVIHGFSVGGYLFAEILTKVAANPGKYKQVTSKIAGQVFDSFVAWESMPIGVAKSLTKNPLIQKWLLMYFSYHLRLFQTSMTQHYVRATKAFNNDMFRCPSLFFFSRDDPVGTAEANTEAVRRWRECGVEVHAKCWDASQHVAHLLHHPEEYMHELTGFLDKIHHLPGPTAPFR